MERHHELDQDCASHESQGESGVRRSINSVRSVLNGKILRATVAGMAICFSAGQALAFQSGKGGESLATNGDTCYNNMINSNLTKTNMPLPKGPSQLNDNPEGQDDKKESNEDKEHDIETEKFDSLNKSYVSFFTLVEGLPERKGTKSVGAYIFKLDNGVIRVNKIGASDTLVFSSEWDSSELRSRYDMTLNKTKMAHIRSEPLRLTRRADLGVMRCFGRNESSFQSKLDQFVKLISDENAKNEEEKRKKDDKKKKEDDKKVKEFRT